jgi:predicted DNA-binding protein YlxM (UPF0122 family)
MYVFKKVLQVNYNDDLCEVEIAIERNIQLNSVSSHILCTCYLLLMYLIC